LPDDRSLFRQDVYLKHISEEVNSKLGEPSGRWIGILRIRGNGLKQLKQGLTELQAHDDFSSLTLPDLFNHLVDKKIPIKVHYIHGHWLDVNSLQDIERAGDFTKT
jgi:phosphoenolpyruvate phosphomutase